MTAHAIQVTVSDRPGLLFGLTRVLADHDANITYVDIHAGETTSTIYFEVTLPRDGIAAVLDGRGERISVDTIPLVGEHELAAAVRAVMRLPRVKLLVLAGSIMGGEITAAVEDVRRNGLKVISLNMAGSVPDAADMVITDPVQAGVMAVMAVADTAKFDLMRQVKRRY